MKTIRTVSRIVHKEEELRQKPEFKIGDYLMVYAGSYENHCFYCKDIRYNHDSRKFEYFGNVFWADWVPETNVVVGR